MIDITKFNTKFNQKKDILVELLIKHYGKEYEQVIRDRLSNLLFDFSSNPDQEYSFLQKHGDQLTERSKKIIELRYLKYERVRVVAWEEAVNKIYHYAEKELSIKCSTLDDFYMFANSELANGYIDSLSSESMRLLDDPNMPESLKEDILKKQSVFNNHQFLQIKPILQQDVDKFIEYRNMVKSQYRIDLIEKSKFCKNIFKDFVKRWETPIPAECFTSFVFDYDGYASSFTTTDDNGIQTGAPYIRLRYLNLKNRGAKCFDTCIVHELIHAIEEDPVNRKFGLVMENSDAEIVNEIKTQKLAIQVVADLRDLGIFIFDDPNDYIIEGQCAYEWLFPFTKDFFEKNKKIILDCAINNTPQKMFKYFGDSYKKFYIELRKLYEDFMIQYNKNGRITATTSDIEAISNIIDEMENYKKENKPKELSII